MRWLSLRRDLPQPAAADGGSATALRDHRPAGQVVFFVNFVVEKVSGSPLVTF
jgi:hypothetical protein